MHAILRRGAALVLLLGAPLAWADGAGPAATGATPGAPIPTVLYRLRSLGIAAEAAASLEASLRNEVAALPEVQLVDPAVLTASLELEHDPDCLARLACAASAASRAGARQFVSGTVSGLGDAVLVDLKLVDARSGEELRRITHPITGHQELLIEILHAAAVELLAPARFVGRLDVKLVQTDERGKQAPAPAADAAGTRIFVDGKLAATLPLTAPIDGLAPGQRAVRVSKEGFRDAALFVEIRFDRTTEASVDLPRGALASVAYLQPNAPAAAPPAPEIAARAPAPRPPESRGPWLKIAGWSALGLGGVSAIVGIAAHIKAYQTASALNAREATNSLSSSDVPLYANVDTEVGAARFLYVLAGLFGAGGGALLLYDHHVEQQAHVEAQPLVTPSGGGVGISGAF